jgi:hypothetical protein
VELFVVRAALSVPGFRVSDANRTTIAQICSKMDGLPLGIELAAARLIALSISGGEALNLIVALQWYGIATAHSTTLADGWNAASQRLLRNRRSPESKRCMASR